MVNFDVEYDRKATLWGGMQWVYAIRVAGRCVRGTFGCDAEMLERRCPCGRRLAAQRLRELKYRTWRELWKRVKPQED